MTNDTTKHVAIIMDGNGRWAKKRLLPRKAGHRAGARVARTIIEAAAKRGISVLTLFAFSSENWQRPEDEVNALMDLFLTNLQNELPLLQKNQIRLKIIGERERFDTELRERIHEVERLTKNNQRMTLILAASYGGRWDICQAVCKLAREAQDKIIEITEDLISSFLSTADFPDPDLLIRTSGERRISNFLLWQCAYSEFYFTSTLWPDFNEAEFDNALAVYGERQRRFGLTQQQISNHA